MNTELLLRIDMRIQMVRGLKVMEMAATHGDLARRLGELERRTEALATQHDAFSRTTRVQLRQVFEALRQWMAPPDPAKRPIGLITPPDEAPKSDGGKNHRDAGNA